jgi:hypothetical protein
LAAKVVELDAAVRAKPYGTQVSGDVTLDEVHVGRCGLGGIARPDRQETAAAGMARFGDDHHHRVSPVGNWGGTIETKLAGDLDLHRLVRPQRVTRLRVTGRGEARADPAEVVRGVIPGVQETIGGRAGVNAGAGRGHGQACG